MNEEQVISYRDKLEDQLKNKDNEIDKSLTYITVGLLGLILTLNEKFVPIKDSEYKWLLVLTISSLIFSFIFNLIKKILTTRADRKLILFLDENDMSCEDKDKDLHELWAVQDNYIRIITFLSYVLLILGLCFEVLYFYINVSNSSKNKDEIIKVQIIETVKDSNPRNNK